MILIRFFILYSNIIDNLPFKRDSSFEIVVEEPTNEWRIKV